MLNLNRERKFATKTRECNLTYALLYHIVDGEDLGSIGKDEIKHITRLFKENRLALDLDYNFIVSS